MAEIEDVTRRATERIEGSAHRLAHARRRRKQRRRIQISLHGHATCGEAARFARVGGPINANGVATALHDGTEPRIAAFRKQDVGHTSAVFLFFQFCDYFL